MQFLVSGLGMDKVLLPLKEMVTKVIKYLKFPILRASVKAYKNNLNTHKSYYKNLEKKENQLRDKNKRFCGLALTDTLKNYAQTGSEYTKILNQIITQNRLSDFELVKLVNSKKASRIELIIIFHSPHIEYQAISKSLFFF